MPRRMGRRRASEPVDGTVVVDSAGQILGTLDSSTGTVVDADGNIVGTLNETTGLVVDSAGAIVGSVTNLIDGASVVGTTGNVIGVLDGDTGNVVDASGNAVGVLDPLTGQVLNTAGDVLGTVTDLINGTTVLDSAGNVVGVLDGATGNVVDSAGNVIGALDPLTGQVLDAAGNVIGTVGEIVDDVTDTIGKLNTGDLLKGDLLNVDVNVDLDADLAAPINGAVAANANVAAPIDASVAANILSDDSEATALAQQDAIINQTITGTAEATSDQVSDINQASIEPPDTDTASADDPVRGRHRRLPTADVRRRRGGGHRAEHGGHAPVTLTVDAPARADDLQLIGEMVGTGYRTPPALVRRSDGQILQLTPLLYRVLEAVDGRRGCAEIAAVVSAGDGPGRLGGDGRDARRRAPAPNGTAQAGRRVGACPQEV